MDLEDPRWPDLEGGYRAPFDARPLLRKLEAGDERSTIWPEIWQELYHQGDVGVASYAAVPQLARIEATRAEPDWETYALVGSIDIARDGPRTNPEIPDWLLTSYRAAIESLAQTALRHLAKAHDPLTSRCMLAIVALWTGHRTYGRLLIDFEEDEVAALEQAAFG